MFRDVREIAVGCALRLENLDLPESGLKNGTKERRLAHSMQRGVDGANISRIRKALADDRGGKCAVDFLADELDRTVANGPIEVEGRDFFCLGDAFDDALIVRRKNLRTTGPIGLKAVIRRRIMRGRDHHADVATQVAHGKRESRGRAISVEEKDRQSVGGKRRGRDAGKFDRTISRIVGDDRPPARLAFDLFEINGHSVRRLGDRPRIDRRRAQVGHSSAAATRAKRNDFPKQAVEFRELAFAHHGNQGIVIVAIRGFGEPHLEIRDSTRRKRSLRGRLVDTGDDLLKIRCARIISHGDPFAFKNPSYRR